MSNFVHKMATKFTEGQICGCPIPKFDCDMIFYFCDEENKLVQSLKLWSFTISCMVCSTHEATVHVISEKMALYSVHHLQDCPQLVQCDAESRKWMVKLPLVTSESV